MFVRLLVAGFLLAHAAIHAGFVSPRPPTSDGSPPWPFDLGRSWLLSPLGVDPGFLRVLGIALLAVTLVSFAAGAAFALGIVPGVPWAPVATAGAIASLVLLLLFFHPWLVLGILIDLAILWVVLVARWDPLGAQT